jgi:hypothetical protein
LRELPFPKMVLYIFLSELFIVRPSRIRFIHVIREAANPEVE